MYALIVVLAMALTGLTWSFEWYRNAFYAVCGVDNSNSPKGNPRQSDKNTGRDNPREVDFSGWQQACDALTAENPDAPQITISAGTASVSRSNFGNVRGADRYTFNPQSGAVSLPSSYSDSSKSDKLRGWISSVHMGSFGGYFSKILWLLCALLGASLPLTGYYIWISHLRKKHK